MRGGPDRWLALSVPVRHPEQTPLLVRALTAAGGRAIEERDGILETFVAPPDDADAFVHALAGHLETLLGEATPRIAWRWQPHEDWARIWKEGLGPRKITDRITVAPTWSELGAEAGEVVIRIDPGIAFGTAEHGSTRTCLRLLEDLLALGDRLLDVGTGTGILAIAAVRLGAEEALALDADPLACAQARENAEANGVGGRVRIEERRLGPGRVALGGRWSGLTANLDPVTLRRLLPHLAGALVAEGWAVLGGIPSEEAREVAAVAQRAGLRETARDEDEGWIALAFRRTPAAPPFAGGDRVVDGKPGERG